MLKRVIEIRVAPNRSWERPAVLDENTAAVLSGDDLWLVDLSTKEHKVLAGICCAAYRRDGFVCADRAGRVRWHTRASGWAESSSFMMALQSQWAQQSPSAIYLSASGRYVVVRTAGAAHLFELTKARHLASFEAPNPAGRASFVRGPRGEDLLFLSAPSYMSVALIDCASATTVHRFEPSTGFDFCHVSYELSADGARLYTFGCTWAAPYTARIYDASPWVAGTNPAAQRFPLPLVFATDESWPFGCGVTVEAIRATPGPDGCVTVSTLIDLTELPQPASEEESDSTPADHTLLSELRALAGKTALLLRRVDPISGTVRAQFLYAPADARAIHVMSNHRALLLGDRIVLVDAMTGSSQDLGPFGSECHGRFLSSCVDETTGTVFAAWS
jgi:hypothetical protein